MESPCKLSFKRVTSKVGDARREDSTIKTVWEWLVESPGCRIDLITEGDNAARNGHIVSGVHFTIGASLEQLKSIGGQRPEIDRFIPKSEEGIHRPAASQRRNLLETRRRGIGDEGNRHHLG